MCWYRIRSVDKETVCNAGDPGLIHGLGRSSWRRDRLPTPIFLGFPCGSVGKESVCNAGDLGLISGLGRCPGEGKGYPLQYSGLEIWVAKNQDMTERLSLSLSTDPAPALCWSPCGSSFNPHNNFVSQYSGISVFKVETEILTILRCGPKPHSDFTWLIL